MIIPGMYITQKNNEDFDFYPLGRLVLATLKIFPDENYTRAMFLTDENTLRKQDFDSRSMAIFNNKMECERWDYQFITDVKSFFGNKVYWTNTDKCIQVYKTTIIMPNGSSFEEPLLPEIGAIIKHNDFNYEIIEAMEDKSTAWVEEIK